MRGSVHEEVSLCGQLVACKEAAQVGLDGGCSRSPLCVLQLDGLLVGGAEVQRAGGERHDGDHDDWPASSACGEGGDDDRDGQLGGGCHRHRCWRRTCSGGPGVEIW